MIIFFLYITHSMAFGQNAFPLDRFLLAEKNMKFPEMSREDIPRLLKMADSIKVVEKCPANPLSSQYVKKCLEGTLALWTIEGIRQGKYPSLNPVLHDTERKVLSDKALLKKAERLYLDWWSKGGKSDPLYGTSLRWY